MTRQTLLPPSPRYLMVAPLRVYYSHYVRRPIWGFHWRGVPGSSNVIPGLSRRRQSSLVWGCMVRAAGSECGEADSNLSSLWLPPSDTCYTSVSGSHHRAVASSGVTLAPPCSFPPPYVHTFMELDSLYSSLGVRLHFYDTFKLSTETRLILRQAWWTRYYNCQYHGKKQFQNSPFYLELKRAPIRTCTCNTFTYPGNYLYIFLVFWETSVDFDVPWHSHKLRCFYSDTSYVFCCRCRASVTNSGGSGGPILDRLSPFL